MEYEYDEIATDKADKSVQLIIQNLWFSKVTLQDFFIELLVK